MLSKTSFVQRKYQLGCLLTRVRKELDTWTRVFYRNFTLINCNPMYPNALDLQNVSWITYGRQKRLIGNPNDMPNYRVKSIGQVLHQWTGFQRQRAGTQQEGPKVKAFEKNDNKKRSFPGSRRFILTQDFRVLQNRLELQSTGS